jgi:acyl-CoA dehydrogenase
MTDEVYPAEESYQRERVADPYGPTPTVERLKAEARTRGLWNLFLPNDEWGAGLTNVEYAPLAEEMGRSVELAPEATNCSAPDTGNMEVLADFGTKDQQQRWLRPLLNGEIRSCFAMTEPGVASSDPRNLETTAVRDGDEYVINGRKWWTTGALSPKCRIAIVMAATSPDAGCRWMAMGSGSNARFPSSDTTSAAGTGRCRSPMSGYPRRTSSPAKATAS